MPFKNLDVNESFTGTNGTELSAHSASFSKLSGADDLEIQSNHCVSTATGDGLVWYYHDATSGPAIGGDLYIVDNTYDSEVYAFLVDGSGDGYGIVIDAAQTIYILRFDAWSPTDTATYAAPFSAAQTVEVALRLGSNLQELFLDGVLVQSSSDSTHTYTNCTIPVLGYGNDANTGEGQIWTAFYAGDFDPLATASPAGVGTATATLELVTTSGVASAAGVGTATAVLTSVTENLGDTIYTAEVDAYDIDGASATTLYFSDGLGMATKPTDTPDDTFFDPRIAQPLDVGRTVYAPGTAGGGSKVGFGDLVLYNPDGALDYLLDYALDGRDIVVRRGKIGDAYPTNFTTVFTGTMDQPEANEDLLTIRVRDSQFSLDAPLQPTKYAGNNSLPNGLEGIADDLKGKPKPLCFGTVYNVPAPCVNTSKLIYQVNDGAVNDVTAVYDRAVELTQGTDYASQADLLNDGLAPAAGYYKVYPAGGYFRLGSSPAGLVTADVEQGAAAGNRTAAQLWTQILQEAGYSGGDWSASDVTALDTAAGYECGTWEDQETTFAAVLDKLANSVGAWWAPDRTGVFRIKQLVAPTGSNAITLTGNDLKGKVKRVPMRDRKLPSYRTVVRYAKNYTIQDASALYELIVEDGSITEAKLATGAVTENKLANSSVTASKTNMSRLNLIATDLGIIVAGRLDNLSASPTRGLRLDSGTTKPPTWTEYIDLAASGSDPVVKFSGLEIDNAGNATFDGDLDAAGGTFGVITGGFLRNAGNTAAIRLSGSETLPSSNYIDFTATGSSAFLKHAALTLEADGDATFGGTVSAESFTGTNPVFNGTVQIKGAETNAVLELGSYSGAFGKVDFLSSGGSTNEYRIRTSASDLTFSQIGGSNGGVDFGSLDFECLGDVTLCNAAASLGFFGVVPTTQPSGYTTFTNLSTDRTCDANSTSVAELADIVGTLIEDLKGLGLLAA